MVPRYHSAEMAKIFSDENRLYLFLEIEALLLEELSKKFSIPSSEIHRLRKLQSQVDLKSIQKWEEKTRHDVTAFLNWIWETLPKEKSVQKFLHFGLTSSDLADTALAVQMREALRLVQAEVSKNLEALKGLAKKYAGLAAMGRTHGIHAEVTSLGLKFLSFYTEGRRQQKRLKATEEEVSYGKLSGSVGNFASSALDAKTEEAILSKLGLHAEPVATQVVPRDRHAAMMTCLALMAGWIERIATEIRHLQRSEVAEMAEPFDEDSQQGSSSMPHKRNPILCENLCGLARLMRGYTLTALENMVLWHERDISHSSAERVAIPDAFHLAHFMNLRLNQILQGLTVNPKRIEKNVNQLKDLSASQKYLNILIHSGVPRPQAYQAIQKASQMALRDNTTLFEELKKDRRLPKGLKIKKIEPKNFLEKVPGIFRRAELI